MFVENRWHERDVLIVKTCPYFHEAACMNEMNVGGDSRRQVFSNEPAIRVQLITFVSGSIV